MRMNATDKYIRTETLFSAIGTIVASVLAYLLVFGVFEPVPTRGFGAYAFDFGPQAFMTALLCTWLPGAITRRRIGRGTIDMVAGAGSRIDSLVLRGLAYATLSLPLAAAPVALAILASGATELPWLIGLAGKIMFGGALAMAVTPVGLRAVLHDPSAAR